MDGHFDPDSIEDRDRALRLVYALASAERTLEALSPALKRALGRQRRPLDRQPRLVRQDVILARRLALDLVERLETARAVLPE